MIHCGDNREWLAGLEPDSHDICVSDPPYADETHDGARTRGKDCEQSGGRLLADDFGSISFNELSETLALAAVAVRRWIVITCDWRHAAKMEVSPPTGLRFVRFGVWVKPNGAPQYTGDRPSQGWEAVAWLHRKDAKLTWNGGGRSSVFTIPRVSGEHPTIKPLPLIRQFVSLTTSGGPVLDPWAGSGTVGVVAAELGLDYSGCEIDPAYAEIARGRIAATQAQGSLFTTQPKLKQASLFDKD